MLLDQSENWEWICENSEASGQVLLYIPQLVATALNISRDDVKVYALQAYEGASYDGNADTLLTAWLGWVPNDLVDSLQAMVKAPNSKFYTSANGILSELAQAIDPSFSLMSYSSEKATIASSNVATDGSSSSNSSGESAKNKKIIIGVVVAGGVLILAIAAALAVRATKSGQIALPGSPRNGHRERDNAPRSFQLGQGNSVIGGGRRDSGSTVSTISSSGSFGGAHMQGRAVSHGMSSSVDHGSADRGSWWRFSGQASNGSGPNAGMTQGEMREGPRRINVVRGANGQLDGSQFGRPMIQSNSLML